jgi:hypothetical protein
VDRLLSVVLVGRHTAQDGGAILHRSPNTHQIHSLTLVAFNENYLCKLAWLALAASAAGSNLESSNRPSAISSSIPAYAISESSDMLPMNGWLSSDGVRPAASESLELKRAWVEGEEQP